MCLDIPASKKKQHAKGMPPDWKFIFEKDRKYKGRRSYVPGLFIFHPDKPAQIYRSATGAVNTVPALKKANPSVVEDFYEHVGIKATDIVKSETIKNVPSYQETTELVSVAPECYSDARASSVATSRTIDPCGKCENCTKDSCGNCARCTSSESGKSSGCLQKVKYLLYSTRASSLVFCRY